MSEAKQQASDVVACLELLVNVAEQIMRGHEPWAEVAVAQLTQYLADARELLDDSPPPPLLITSVGDFHFGEGYEPFDTQGQRREWLRERIKVYGNLSAAYQRLVDELNMRLKTEV
jgi:hypothetical protein